MKTLYIDCGMGAAGDMLTAALAELTGNVQETVQQLNQLGIPGVVYTAETSEKCGITGTHMKVEYNGVEEGEHTHDGHTHSHQNMHGIEHIVKDHLNVSDAVKEQILNVYKEIASAESRVHGAPVEEIHFHEVGAMDAVADITAVCWLMDQLKPDQVIASPVHVGKGTVKCAHGILPVPAPATALILEGVPVYSKELIDGELCTPTGAALLKTFVDQFGAMPVMKLKKTGYGMGKKDFPIANCVRVLLGEESEDRDQVTELRFNVDDMTAEEIAFAQSRLLEEGAFEVFLTAVQMKKGRPGTLFTVLTTEKKKDEVVKVIFKHTSTLGIREFHSGRYVLKRSIVTEETPYGPVRRKEAEGYGVKRHKYEYDDLAAIALKENRSIDEIRAELEKKN